MNKKSAKIIFSQGLTKIHFAEVVDSLNEIRSDYKILFITGWTPKNLPVFLVNLIGNLVGRNNLYKRLIIRLPKTSFKVIIRSNLFPEALYWFYKIVFKRLYFWEDLFVTYIWKTWGYFSQRYLSNNFEIFHVRSGAGQGGAIKLAKQRGLVTIADHSIAHPKYINEVLIDEYTQYGFSSDINEKNKFWRLVINDCLESDYILVNSDFVKKTFVQNGFEANKIEVIYWGVREDFFFLKEKYELNIYHPKLLFTGSFDIRKGCFTIVEALNLLKERGVYVEVDIVGPMTEEGSRALTYLVDKTMIKIHGMVLQDGLKGFLRDSDIYIFPTFAEGSARSVMEALAAGMPVITTENCGVPIVHEFSGLLIPTNSPKILADTIIKLINNKELRIKYGTNAAKLISKSYTWKKYAFNIDNFYNRILSERK
jgi:glycosyltransferase involved in cell wall biosynthesis